ncbi:MAG: hypothetical protein NWE89_11825 [Candidatus Bathyarchaeota archaeon]|nr:hypothetical protein [Candidatus Bathyarchaeota archaeon]
MPRVGYKGITVPERVKKRLTEIATRENRTVPRQIEHMLDRLYPEQQELTGHD